MERAKKLPSILLATVALVGAGCYGTVVDGEPPGAGGSVAPAVPWQPSPSRPGVGAPGTPAPGTPAPGTPAPGTPGTPPAPTASGAAPRFFRLAHREWENTMRDLLGVAAGAAASASFTGDPKKGRFDNAGALLQVTSGLWADYQAAAETLAEQATADAVAIARLVPGPLPADASARARAFVEGFGLRAYRRPLVPDEVARALELFAAAPKLLPGKEPFAAGARVVVEAMLQSPHALYRAERAAPGKPLGPYEVASKLSYALTATMPDAELFAGAASGGLATANGVRAQASRLLARPQSRRVLEDFHEQLLHTEAYESIEKDRTLFPGFVPALTGDLREETVRFLRDVLFERVGGLRELLLDRTAFVNRRLAPIYGFAGASTDELRRVELDPAERAGLLTRAGFLAANANLRDIDSIHRGVFVHDNVLCTQLPPPVPNVSLANFTGRTNRERVNNNTGPGTCGEGCHSRIINPIGFAFERYDAIGRHRTTEDGVTIDAADSYAFDGGSPRWFNGAVELSKILAETADAHRCYARHLFEFLSARPPSAADDAAIELLGRGSHGGDSTAGLVLRLVTSEAFLTRGS